MLYVDYCLELISTFNKLENDENGYEKAYLINIDKIKRWFNEGNIVIDEVISLSTVNHIQYSKYISYNG